jgi:hypothetical protein
VQQLDGGPLATGAVREEDAALTALAQPAHHPVAREAARIAWP